ncbi:MAG TPA: hypothetical protein VG474_07720 [Solirubrobacteraceae bacterium]|nr:hypothetical protein [Solirubrobacteraceae bacterium]
MRERTIWIAAGLLGLLVAVGLAVLTNHVARPPVGLSGEPVSAGEQLAPPRTARTATTPARRRGATTPARTAPTAPPPPVAPAVPGRDDDDRDDNSGSGSDDGSGSGSDDSSGSGSDDGSGSDGRGRGRGRGRGGDD